MNENKEIKKPEETKEPIFLPREILKVRYEMMKDQATECECGAKTCVGEDATLLYTCHSCGMIWDHSAENWETGDNFYKAYYHFEALYKKLRWNLVDLPKKIMEMFGKEK